MERKPTHDFLSDLVHNNQSPKKTRCFPLFGPVQIADVNFDLSATNPYLFINPKIDTARLTQFSRRFNMKFLASLKVS